MNKEKCFLTIIAMQTKYGYVYNFPCTVYCGKQRFFMLGDVACDNIQSINIVTF